MEKATGNSKALPGMPGGTALKGNVNATGTGVKRRARSVSQRSAARWGTEGCTRGVYTLAPSYRFPKAAPWTHARSWMGGTRPDPPSGPQKPTSTLRHPPPAPRQGVGGWGCRQLERRGELQEELDAAVRRAEGAALERLRLQGDLDAARCPFPLPSLNLIPWRGGGAMGCAKGAGTHDLFIFWERGGFGFQPPPTSRGVVVRSVA